MPLHIKPNQLLFLSFSLVSDAGLCNSHVDHLVLTTIFTVLKKKHSNSSPPFVCHFTGDVNETLNSFMYRCILHFSCRPWLHRMSSWWNTRQRIEWGVMRMPSSGLEKRLLRNLVVFINSFVLLWTGAHPCYHIWGYILNVMHNFQTNVVLVILLEQNAGTVHQQAESPVTLVSTAGAANGKTRSRESPRSVDSIITGSAGSCWGRWTLKGLPDRQQWVGIGSNGSLLIISVHCLRF